MSDEDRDMLNSEISKPEIRKIFETMSHNKSPGIDGLPVEAYEENWEVIGNDMLILYETILDNGLLSDSQRKAVITLVPETNNPRYIIY